MADGFTVTDVPVTVPTPGLMLNAGEPVTAHLSVQDCPAATIVGVAVKLVMVGRLPAVTVTVALLEPKLLVAVRM